MIVYIILLYYSLGEIIPLSLAFKESLATGFELKSVLSDISIATPALFWFPLAWSIFFHPFTLSLCVSLDTKGSFL